MNVHVFDHAGRLQRLENEMDALQRDLPKTYAPKDQVVGLQQSIEKRLDRIEGLVSKVGAAVIAGLLTVIGLLLRAQLHLGG